jgi:hypothetical protein
MHGQVAGAARWLLPLDQGQGRLARQYTVRPPGGRGLSTGDRGAWQGSIIIRIPGEAAACPPGTGAPGKAV